MYREFFIRARDALKAIGYNPQLKSHKGSLSEHDIDTVIAEKQCSLPNELRDFFLEMGDGFEFVPDSGGRSDLIGWEPVYFNDFVICNKLSEAVEEDYAFATKHAHSKIDPRALEEEKNRRINWIPIYGFIGRGDFICLDSEGRVQYFQSQDWAIDVELCTGFTLADSFHDFVKFWSRFRFISPGGGWGSFCWNRIGVFDWNPDHFSTKRK